MNNEERNQEKAGFGKKELLKTVNNFLVALRLREETHDTIISKLIKCLRKNKETELREGGKNCWGEKSDLINIDFDKEFYKLFKKREEQEHVMATRRKSCEFIKKHETECVILLLAVMPTLILVLLALLSQRVIDTTSANLVTEFANNLYQDQIKAQKLENYAIVFQLNDQVQRVAWQMRLLTAFLSKVVEGNVTINTGYVASKLNIDRAYTDNEDPAILSLFQRSQFLVSSWHQINASYVSDLNAIQNQELLMGERLDPLWRSVKYDNSLSDWKKLMIRDIYLTHEYDGLIYMTSINTTYVNYTIPTGCQYLGKWRLDLRCRYYYEATMKFPGLQLFDPQILYTADSPYLASLYCTRYLKKNGDSLPSSDPSSYSRYGLICTSIDLRAVSSYFSSLNSYSKYRMVVDPLKLTVIYNSEAELSYNKITNIYDSEAKYLQNQTAAKLFISKLHSHSQYLLANLTDLRTQHVSIDSLQTNFEYDRNGTSCFAIVNRVTMIDKPLQREIDTKQASQYQLKLAFLFLDVLSKKKMTEYAENLKNQVELQSQIFFHVTWSINVIILLIDLYSAFLLAARVLLPVANLTKILLSIQFSDSLRVIEQQNQQLNRQNSKMPIGFLNEKSSRRLKSMPQINRATSLMRQDTTPMSSKFKSQRESPPEFVSSQKIPHNKDKNNPSHIIDSQDLGSRQIIHIQADQPKILLSPLNSNRIMRLTKTLKENTPNSYSNSNQLLQEESSNLEEEQYPMEDWLESINTESVSCGERGILAYNPLEEVDDDGMFLSSDMKVLFESFQSMFRVLSFTTQNLFKENESVSLLNLNNQVQHFEKFGNHRALGVCNNNIGFLHYNAKRYKEALQYFDAAALHAKYELGFYSDELNETTAAIQSCLRQASEFTCKDLFEYQQLSAMSISEKKGNYERYSGQSSAKKQSFQLNNNYQQQNSIHNWGSEVLPMTPSIEPRANHKISCDELINNQIENSPIRNENQLKSQIHNSQNLLNENRSANIEQDGFLESPKLQDISYQDIPNRQGYENMGMKSPLNSRKTRDKEKSGFFNQTPQNQSIQTSLSAEREELCWSLYNRRMNYAKTLYSLLSESKESSFIQMWSVFESVAIETAAISQVLLPQSYKREMLNYQLIAVSQTMQSRQLEAKETLSKFSALYIKDIQEKGKNKKNILGLLNSRNKEISFYRQQQANNENVRNQNSQGFVEESRLDIPQKLFHPTSNVSIGNDIVLVPHKSSYCNNANAPNKKQQYGYVFEEDEQSYDSKQYDMELSNKKMDQIVEDMSPIVEEVKQIDDLRLSRSFQENHFMGGAAGTRAISRSSNNRFVDRYPNMSPRSQQELHTSHRFTALPKSPLLTSSRTKSVHRISPLQAPSKPPLYRFQSTTQEFSQLQKNHEEGGDNQSGSPSHKTLLQAVGFSQQSEHLNKEAMLQKSKTAIQESPVNSTLESPEISSPPLLFQTQKPSMNLLTNPQSSQTLVQWTKLPMLKDQDSKDNLSIDVLISKHHQFIMNERINHIQKAAITSKPNKLKKLESFKSSCEDLRNSISLMSKVSAQHKLEKTAGIKKTKTNLKHQKKRHRRGDRQQKNTLYKPFKRSYYCVRKIDKGEALSKSEFSFDIIFTHYIILQALFWMQRGNIIDAANLLTVPLEQCEYYLPHMRSFILFSIHDILKSHALNDSSLDEMVRNSKMSQQRMFRIVVASTGQSQFSQQRTYFLCNDLISEILFRPTDWFGLLQYDHSEKLFSTIMAFTKKSIISQAPVRFDSILKDALIFSFPFVDNVLTSSSSLEESLMESSSGKFKPMEILVPRKQSQKSSKSRSSSLSSSSQSSPHTSSDQSIPVSFNFVDENVASTAREKIADKYCTKRKENVEEGDSPNKSPTKSQEPSKFDCSEQPKPYHLSLIEEPEKSDHTCISSFSKYQCITETIFNRKTRQAQQQQSSASCISVNSQIKPPPSPQLSLLHSTNIWNNNNNKSQDIFPDEILVQPSFSRNNSSIPLQQATENQATFVQQEINHSCNAQSVATILEDDGVCNSEKEQIQKQRLGKYYLSQDIQFPNSRQFLEHGQKRKQLLVDTSNHTQESSKNRSKYFQQQPSPLVQQSDLDPQAVRQHSFTFSKPVHIPSSHISVDQVSPSKSPPKSASIPKTHIFFQSQEPPSKIPPKSACLARTNKLLYPKNSNKSTKNAMNQLPLGRQRSSEETFHLAIQASLKNYLLDSSSKISCYLSEKRYRRSKQAEQTQDRRHQMQIKTFLIYATDEELKFENKQLFNDLCQLLKDLRVELLVLFLNSKQQLEEYSPLEDVMLGAMSVMKFFASEQKLLQYVYNQREHVSNQTRPLIVEHF